MTAISPSRARARQIDGIVLEILKAMSTGRWGPAMALHLAERENVSDGTVRNWADQAGRHLRLVMTEDIDSLRAQNAAHLAAIAADAHESEEYGAAVRAREAIAKLLGLNAPERVEVQQTPLAGYAQMTPEERVRWLDERIAALQEEREEQLRSMALTVASEEP